MLLMLSSCAGPEEAAGQLQGPLIPGPSPAMVRQEAEGGLLLVNALVRCCAGKTLIFHVQAMQVQELEG